MIINSRHTTTVTPSLGSATQTCYVLSCTCAYRASRATLTEALLAELEHEDRVVRGVVR